ncbi:energy transducer TonB [Aquiflexum sp. LQ15W]|uniref:energy transducer TonB n=1 Tax=Cognataquiflexum nitidum TaxID=2922272 RepID=UPI001F14807A|nr:energy transducer TonB [Cognataquiflexum nitidum]MCH6201979.1 energy transducer TonB [Cognataquiflexum nitidum]
MASKKSFLIALLVLLLPLISHSQVLQYYNRHFIAIKDTAAYKPVYFRALSQGEPESTSKYFRMDNSLAMEQANEKDASGKIIRRNTARFGEDAYLSRNTFRDYVRDSIVETTFFANGNLKSSKTTVKNEVLENLFFDEEGIPKPAPIYENALPEGGMGAWRNFLIQNLKYPKSLIDEAIEGKADIFFELDESGKITLFEVMNLEYVHPDLAKEAIRVFGLFAEKPWNPTKIDGIAVKSTMILPIAFTLED